MRTEQFMGVKIKWDIINDRNRLQQKAEKGNITPLAYWHGLRASWSNMTADEKTEEYYKKSY